MNRLHQVLIVALLLLPAAFAFGQDMVASNSPAVSSGDPRGTGIDGWAADDSPGTIHRGMITSQSTGSTINLHDRFRAYLDEAFCNPAALTAPAFRAGIRMASPPTRGAYTYPNEWRQGAEGFGRNLGDASAARLTTHTARFLAGAVMREDPRYFPSTSHNPFTRSFHAIGFTFVDRSDSGRMMPAISNFAGAAAGAAVGMAYLPPGFDTASYAGRRAIFNFAALTGSNAFREFAPRIPAPVRVIVMLIAN